jgi:tRNA threonylcarbamoyladenosine biosynthesis protein TsaE
MITTKIFCQPWKIPSLAHLSVFASRLAKVSKVGDLFLLKGELGVGKTAFARAFLQERTNIRDLEVVSPSFTLNISYDHNNISYHHMDLHRLKSRPDLDLHVLNIPNSIKNGICLIEWGDRLPENLLPPDFLVVRWSSSRSSSCFCRCCCNVVVFVVVCLLFVVFVAYWLTVCFRSLKLMIASQKFKPTLKPEP